MKALLIVAVCFLSSCSMIAKMIADKPDVDLTSVKVESVSFAKVKMAFGVKISNPNNFELGVNELDYKVYAGSKQLGSGHFKDEFKVAAKSEATLQIPFELKAMSAIEIASKYVSGGAKGMAFRIEGRANFQTPIGSYSHDFDESKEL